MRECLTIKPLDALRRVRSTSASLDDTRSVSWSHVVRSSTVSLTVEASLVPTRPKSVHVRCRQTMTVPDTMEDFTNLVGAGVIEALATNPNSLRAVAKAGLASAQ